jgi:hypothetical protein
MAGVVYDRSARLGARLDDINKSNEDIRTVNAPNRKQNDIFVFPIIPDGGWYLVSIMFTLYRMQADSDLELSKQF